MIVWYEHVNGNCMIFSQQGEYIIPVFSMINNKLKGIPCISKIFCNLLDNHLLSAIFIYFLVFLFIISDLFYYLHGMTKNEKNVTVCKMKERFGCLPRLGVEDQLEI